MGAKKGKSSAKASPAKASAKQPAAAPPAPRRGLGRGLEALLAPAVAPRAQSQPPGEADPVSAPVSGASSASNGLQTLPLARIHPADYQPRQHFDPQALSELAHSIGEKGVLQPLLVRPRGDGFEIVAGERRYRASKLAGLREVPVVIRDLADREALEIAIIENLQRADLSPLEEARAYQALMEQGHTQESIAQVLGKGRSTITNTLRLLGLSGDAQKALEDGRITAGHARALLSLPEEARSRALQKICSADLSVREAEALAKELLAERREPKPSKRSRPWGVLERRLSDVVGTSVRIQGDERGKIELSYRSPEERERLLELLRGSEKKD